MDKYSLKLRYLCDPNGWRYCIANNHIRLNDLYGFGYQTNYGFSVLERGQFLMAKHQNIDVGQLYIFIDDDFSKLPIDISTSCLLLDNLRAQAEYAMKQSEAAEQALIEQAREMQEFKRSQSFITTQQPVALTRRHEQLNQLRQNVFKIPER